KHVAEANTDRSRRNLDWLCDPEAVFQTKLRSLVWWYKAELVTLFSRTPIKKPPVVEPGPIKGTRKLVSLSVEEQATQVEPGTRRWTRTGRFRDPLHAQFSYKGPVVPSK